MSESRNDIIDEAIEKIRDCELVEPNVKRIRLNEAVGALLELKTPCSIVGEYTNITEGIRDIMRDMKEASSVDQCKGCTLMGDIKACEAIECSNHDNWYPMQLKEENKQLKAKAVAFDEMSRHDVGYYHYVLIGDGDPSTGGNQYIELKFPQEKKMYRGSTLLEAVNNAIGES